MKTTTPVALVTGAAGGIGMALVRAFEDAGWQVVSVDREPLERVGHVIADIADCNNPESAAHQDLVARLRAATGGQLKALVANAAHQVVKPCIQLSAADWALAAAVASSVLLLEEARKLAARVISGGRGGGHRVMP